MEVAVLVVKTHQSGVRQRGRPYDKSLGSDRCFHRHRRYLTTAKGLASTKCTGSLSPSTRSITRTSVSAVGSKPARNVCFPGRKLNVAGDFTGARPSIDT